MLCLLRTRLPGLLALVLAALTLLPPSGWALCVAPGGHVEVEPVALAGGGCCEAPAADTATDVESERGDCDSCSDLTAFDGSLTLARSLGRSSLAPLVSLTPVPTLVRAPRRESVAPPRATARPPASALRTGTLLRN
jgi:hypothetical protein